MQLSQTKKDGPGQQSCTDVEPRFAWDQEIISVAYGCSHGTIIWVHMTPTEAASMIEKLTAIVDDIEAGGDDQVE